MFKEMSRGRFKGHPVHAMLVHFPIGLFTAGFCFDLAAVLWTGAAHLPLVSFYCIAGGAAGGLAAMLFGIIDYVNLANNDPLYKKAGRHALLQGTAFILFVTVFGLKALEFPEISETTAVMLILEAVGFSAMTAGNFIGGELIYKDGVGTSGGTEG